MANQFRGRAGPRRRTEWAGFGNKDGSAVLPTLLAVTAGTPVVLSKDTITAGVAAVVAQEYTITRMLGFVTVAMDLTTANLIASVAVGCGVMREDAITAGVTALPDPEADPDFEWLFHMSIILKNYPANAVTCDTDRKHIPFDVRGQRIVRAGNIPFWIAQADTSVDRPFP